MFLDEHESRVARLKQPEEAVDVSTGVEVEVLALIRLIAPDLGTGELRPAMVGRVACGLFGGTVDVFIHGPNVGSCFFAITDGATVAIFLLAVEDST